MDSKKRILIVIKGLGRGGAEQLLLNAAPYLNRDQFDYHLAYFLPWKDALHAELEDSGIGVTCLNVGKMFDPRSVTRLRRLIKSKEIDLIHSHLPWSSIVARAANRKIGLPHIYTEHGRWERLNRLTRIWNRRTMQALDKTIAVSQSVADSMIVPTGHVLEVIENGIDPSPFESCESNREDSRRMLGIQHDESLILSVANLSPVKGHELLIDALPHVISQHGNVRLLLAGQTRGRDEALIHRANSLGVSAYLELLGPRDDIPELLAAADVCAISSHSEGLPISLLEAMASGTPVVSTSVGGIPSVLEHGVSGMLVNGREPARYGEALNKVLAEKSLRTTLAENATAVVQSRFHVQSMVSKTEEIYFQSLKELNTAHADSALHI